MEQKIIYCPNPKCDAYIGDMIDGTIYKGGKPVEQQDNCPYCGTNLSFSKLT